LPWLPLKVDHRADLRVDLKVDPRVVLREDPRVDPRVDRREDPRVVLVDPVDPVDPGDRGDCLQMPLFPATALPPPPLQRPPNPAPAQPRKPAPSHPLLRAQDSSQSKIHFWLVLFRAFLDINKSLFCKK